MVYPGDLLLRPDCMKILQKLYRKIKIFTIFFKPSKKSSGKPSNSSLLNGSVVVTSVRFFEKSIARLFILEFSCFTFFLLSSSRCKPEIKNYKNNFIKFSFNTGSIINGYTIFCMPILCIGYIIS